MQVESFKRQKFGKNPDVRILLSLLKQIETDSLLQQAIFLVGGFGANMHLKDYLSKSLGTIEVIQPNDA
jgi:hypothetical protein